MIGTTEQIFQATTTRRQVRSRDARRLAYTLQNQAALGGAEITVAASQTGPGIILQPREIIGRDVFSPGNEIWIECSAGTANLYIGEDYDL